MSIRSPKNRISQQSIPSKALWHRGWKVLASFLLVFHLLGLVAEPLQMISKSRMRAFAPDTMWLRSCLAPYVEFAYLDHGYFFFAPDPGPNHLIEARITEPNVQGESNGNATLWKRIPDRQVHWPRLFYHRHFMLSEFYNNVSVPLNAPPQDLPEVVQAWQREVELYRQLQASIKKHLRGDAMHQEIELRRIRHLLPSPNDILIDGKLLNDPTFYVTLPEEISIEPQAGETLPVGLGNQFESLKTRLEPH